VLTGTLGTTATLAVAMTVVAEVDTMSVLPLLLAGAEHTAETSLPLALTPTAAEAAGLMMTVVKTPPLDFDSILT
jgi:3-deoxy-D-arabino-heptulosonate 7-phosphate (DAHP) synthase